MEKTGTAVDLGAFTSFTMVLAILFYFILWPIISILYEAFTVRGQLTVSNFQVFFLNPIYSDSFINSLLLATATVLLTSLIGIPLAYIFARYNFPGKNVLQVLALVPMVMPPFVGALGLTFIFGLHGTINLILWRDLRVISEPINFIYGLHGVVFVETIHLYPLIFLNCIAALANVDPSLEEQAKNLGAEGFRLFRTVTFPLMLPGYAAGAILTFIWAFSDLGTPLMLGHQAFKLLPVQVFFQVTDIYPIVGYVGSVIMAAVSLVALWVVRKYISLRQYAVIPSGTSPSVLTKRIGGFKFVAVYTFLLSLSTLALLPHFGVVVASFSEAWSMTPLPRTWTLKHYHDVLIASPTYVSNTLLYCLVAALIDIFLGAVIAFLLVRKSFPGKGVLDMMAMLPFAVPGIVLGFGYIRAYKGGLLDPFGPVNAGLPFTLMLALAFRRLPYTVRASYASLQQIHESLEEASLNIGADRKTTFLRITLPLMTSGLIAGGILAFSNAMVEVSTSFLLIRGETQWNLTRAIYENTRNPLGGLQMGSATGVILVLVVVASLVFTNRVFGRRMGMLFRA